MISWELQNKFVKRVLKGETLFWDHDTRTEEVAFGDGFHFYVMPWTKVYMDLHHLEATHENLRQVNLLCEFHKMNFVGAMSFTFDVRKKDKGELRRFENNENDIWINEAYLKEFGWQKDIESYRIGCDPDKGYKKPIIFESEYITAVILPVRVGGQE